MILIYIWLTTWVTSVVVFFCNSFWSAIVCSVVSRLAFTWRVVRTDCSSSCRRLKTKNPFPFTHHLRDCFFFFFFLANCFFFFSCSSHVWHCLLRSWEQNGEKKGREDLCWFSLDSLLIDISSLSSFQGNEKMIRQKRNNRLDNHFCPSSHLFKIFSFKGISNRIKTRLLERL